MDNQAYKWSTKYRLRWHIPNQRTLTSHRITYHIFNNRQQEKLKAKWLRSVCDVYTLEITCMKTYIALWKNTNTGIKKIPLETQQPLDYRRKIMHKGDMMLMLRCWFLWLNQIWIAFLCKAFSWGFRYG